MPAIDRELVTDIVRTAAAARVFLEPRWPVYREAVGFIEGEAPSAATCLITTKFLQAVFADRGMKSDCLYGLGEQGRGYCNGEGWSNHGWLRISGFDLDGTADQFGNKPITIKPAGSDPHYQAACGTYDLNKIEQVFLDRWIEEWRTAALAASLGARQPAMNAPQQLRA